MSQARIPGPDAPATSGTPARFRLIATDLDGTFLAPDQQLHPACVSAVRQAASRGAQVVFATGRPRRWTVVLEPLLDISYTLIASNGAVVVDPHARRVLDFHALGPDQALGFAADLAELVPDVCFAVEYALDGWGADTMFAGHETAERPDHVDTLSSLVHIGPVVKLIALSPSTPTESLARACRQASDGRVNPTFSFARSAGFVECSAPGVSKASALSAILDEQAVTPDEAMAFGDMPNDLEMLALVGHPYVMANSHASVLESGYPVAGSNAEGGVGAVIARELGLDQG
ncbi:hypothetical protein SAMN05443377_1065 [Propionibacterium cyclohexanicum]|uniref:Cof subfamily of IIB subfamily of haloacid dehalogenase superfamily/HAD-superfamily hydrolase, subfamily IIB n=1 Tax=Propionibacterium cyclohexanicum TaxID=64702 RepID=A0A1H9R5U5_9ACTN|nr:HAD family hydrolase [Propionibacterium cyclohexanicum]SER68124.1 hypothetical protein SAMN05443377_1065 [Propionibacterium cyclohexanicum]